MTVISTIYQFIWLLAYCLEPLVAINLKCTQNYQKISRIKLSLSANFSAFFCLFNSSMWVFFHEHSRITGLHEKEGSISLTPRYYSHPLHRHLGISWAIAAESSRLHVASSRTGTGNLWFARASRQPLSYATLLISFN